MAKDLDNIKTDMDMINVATLGALGGALGGVAGFGVSSAVAGWLGTTGAIPGFLTSASGGFAGGFAGTSVTSWCTGASFGEGLMAGLKAGAIGGLTAGLIGAHNGAVDAVCAGGEMWWGIGAHHDLLAPDFQGVPINEEYPNLRNFSNYDIIEPEETAWLQHRTAWNYKFVAGEMKVESLTTQTPNDCTFDSGTGLFVRDDNGKSILGRVVYSKIGKSTVHISPYAATHPSNGIFRAIVGHELTHAYHYFAGLPAHQDGSSERAALDCSYMEYYRAGYSDLCGTIPSNNVYPRRYYVPKEYGFSTISFFEKLKLGR